MPITPYTAPIKYEYKPLGLEAFAAPLSKMQEKFDITKLGIQAEDFDLSHLPYGTDPQRAKELKEIVTSKRDELAKNLYETKNYREAGQKLLELRKLWKNDPEINAIQTNYKQFQELDKGQKERVDKGELTRDQYLQWKNRAVDEYTTKGGTSFKATPENREGDYNKFGRVTRLKNLDKDIEDKRIQIMQLQPEKVRDYFSQNGMTLSDKEVHSIETNIKEKNYNELKNETEAVLRRQPQFTEYLSEVADYNFNDLKKNPEQYKQVGNQLANNYLKNSTDYITRQEVAAKKGDRAAQEYLKSDSYKKLKETQDDLNKMITTGNYDDNLIKNLYTEQHLDKVFSSGELANVLAYKNQTSSHSFRNLPKEGDGEDKDKELGLGFFTPNTYEKVDITGIGKQRLESGKVLYNNLKDINKIANGVMGIAIMGQQGTKEREEISKDPAAMRARANQILTAASITLANNGDYRDFHSKLKNIGVSERAAATLWNEFTKKDSYALNSLKQQLENTEYDNNNYINAKEQLNSLNQSASKNSDYKFIMNDKVGNLSPFIETSKQSTLFSGSSYSDEQLKKAGINKNNLKYQDAIGIDHIRPLNFNEVAKLKGYKDVNDALSQGFNFENTKVKSGANVGEINSGKLKVNLFALDDKEYKSLNDISSSLKQQLIDQNLVKNEMSYRYINDTKVDKVLSKFFLEGNDLSNFQPAYTSTQQNMPGFDSEGKLLPSTQLDINTNTMPKIVKHGNSVFYEVPIKYKNEDGQVVETTTVIKPKKGAELSTERLLNHMDEATTGGDNLNRQSNDMVKVMKFDQRFNTNFSNTLTKGINVGEGKGSQTTVTSLPYGVNAPGVTIDIVKVSTGDGGSTMKVAITNGGEKIYLKNPETNKDFYSDDADAIKAFISKQIGL